jgi:hypothetical protein
MALPSCSKRGYDEICGRREGRGTFLSFSKSCFISFYLVPTSQCPETYTFASGARCGPNEFWLMAAVISSQHSLFEPPIRDWKSVSSFHLSNEASGDKNSSREWFRKGFLAREPFPKCNQEKCNVSHMYTKVFLIIANSSKDNAFYSKHEGDIIVIDILHDVKHVLLFLRCSLSVSVYGDKSRGVAFLQYMNRPYQRSG